MKKSSNEIRRDINKNNFLNKDKDGFAVGSEHLHVLEQMPYEDTHDTIKHEGMGNDTLISDFFELDKINGAGYAKKVSDNKIINAFSRAREQDTAKELNRYGFLSEKFHTPRTTWDFLSTKRRVSNRDMAIYCAIKELVNMDNPDSRKFWSAYDRVKSGQELTFSVDLANPRRDNGSQEKPNYAYNQDGTERKVCWGHGIRLRNGKLEEVRTPGVTVAFEKTRQDRTHPFGLAFKTAFPYAGSRSAIKTGRDLTPELNEILMFDKIKNQAAKAYIRATVMAGPDSDLTLEYHNGYQCVKADNEYGSELVSKDDKAAMNYFVMYYHAHANITNQSIKPAVTVYENGHISLNKDAITYSDDLSYDFSRILEGIKEDLQLETQRVADEIFESIRSGRTGALTQPKTKSRQKCQDEFER